MCSCCRGSASAAPCCACRRHCVVWHSSSAPPRFDCTLLILSPSPTHSKRRASTSRQSVPRRVSTRSGSPRRRSSAGFGDLLTWLDGRRPDLGPKVVCHGDIHPFNMLVTPDGSYNLLDWTNGNLCRREYDVGFTAAMVQCAPVRCAEGRRRPDAFSDGLGCSSLHRRLSKAGADQPRRGRVVRDAAVRSLPRGSRHVADRRSGRRRPTSVQARGAGDGSPGPA